MSTRLIFLCARGSSRSLLAASILSAQVGSRWEVWCTPTRETWGVHLTEQVLHEQGIALISSDRLIEPTFGMSWDEGIILCSGAADT